MGSPADQIAGYLHDEHIVVRPSLAVNTDASLVLRFFQDEYAVLTGADGWPVFVGTEPAGPDECVTVYDTGGAEDNAEGSYYSPTVMVRVRANDYITGYNKAAEIRDQLILPRDRQFAGWHWTGFWLISDVAKIGRDGNGRELFTVNFRIMRQPMES